MPTHTLIPKHDPTEGRAEPHNRRPHLVRRREAARILGLSPGTLRNWGSCRKGPAFSRLGSVVVYDVAELARFAEAGRVETTGAA